MNKNRPKGLQVCAMCKKAWFSNMIYLVKTNTNTKVCKECNELIERAMGTQGKLVIKGRKLSGATI